MTDLNTILLIVSLSTGVAGLLLFGRLKKLHERQTAVKPIPIPIRKRGVKNDVH